VSGYMFSWHWYPNFAHLEWRTRNMSPWKNKLPSSFIPVSQASLFAMLVNDSNGLMRPFQSTFSLYSLCHPHDNSGIFDGFLSLFLRLHFHSTRDMSASLLLMTLYPMPFVPTPNSSHFSKMQLARWTEHTSIVHRQLQIDKHREIVKVEYQ
jgi:hypothetical protein